MVEGDSNHHPSGWQLSLLHAQLLSFLLVPTSFKELVLLAALRAEFTAVFVVIGTLSELLSGKQRRRGEGVKKSGHFADIIYGSPLMADST